jgi:hypothetical protein
MVIRSWDMEKGKLLAEIPVPHVRDGFSDQWEGMSLERRRLDDSGPNQEVETILGTTPNLRASRTSGAGNSDVLLLHMTLDTPAEIWSFLVKEGDTRGSFSFPSCAAARHVIPQPTNEVLTTTNNN